MFKGKPSLRRYTVTFDVKPVFECIKEIACLDNTYLEIRPKILATIVCLLNGQRLQTLSLLQTNSMYIHDSRVIFYISKLIKASRPNFHQKPLEFLAYPSEKAICVVRTIQLYLDKTANLRDKNMYFFFISYVAPYAPVTPKAIACWVVETLGKTGINAKTFKARATRSASTSTAYNKGLSLSKIDKTAGWSNFTTFVKFYNKLKDVNNFGLRILNRTS